MLTKSKSLNVAHAILPSNELTILHPVNHDNLPIDKSDQHTILSLSPYNNRDNHESTYISLNEKVDNIEQTLKILSYSKEIRSYVKNLQEELSKHYTQDNGEKFSLVPTDIHFNIKDPSKSSFNIEIIGRSFPYKLSYTQHFNNFNQYFTMEKNNFNNLEVDTKHKDVLKTIDENILVPRLTNTKEIDDIIINETVPTLKQYFPQQTERSERSAVISKLQKTFDDMEFTQTFLMKFTITQEKTRIFINDLKSPSPFPFYLKFSAESLEEIWHCFMTEYEGTEELSEYLTTGDINDTKTYDELTTRVFTKAVQKIENIFHDCASYSRKKASDSDSEDRNFLTVPNDANYDLNYHIYKS